MLITLVKHVDGHSFVKDIEIAQFPVAQSH